MLTICPSCDTSYTIPDGKIGPLGRTVRCSRCREKWHVMLADDPEPQPDEDPDLDPAADPWAAAAEAGEEASQSDVDDIFARGVGAEEDDGDVVAFDTSDDTPAAPQPERDGPQAAGFEPPEAVAEPARPLPIELAGPRPAADDPVPRTIETAARPTIKVKPRTAPSLWMLAKKQIWRLRAALFRWRLSVGVTIFLLSMLVPVGVIVFRVQVVRHVPQIAGIYAELGMPVNLAGLEFRNLNTLRELENGQPVLVVEGSVANITLNALYVPSVRMALRGADGQEIYAWSVDPKATTVPAGDEVRFRTRLAAPPEEAVDVQLRFIERKTRQAVLP